MFTMYYKDTYCILLLNVITILKDVLFFNGVMSIDMVPLHALLGAQRSACSYGALHLNEYYCITYYCILFVKLTNSCKGYFTMK